MFLATSPVAFAGHTATFTLEHESIVRVHASYLTKGKHCRLIPTHDATMRVRSRGRKLVLDIVKPRLGKHSHCQSEIAAMRFIGPLPRGTWTVHLKKPGSFELAAFRVLGHMDLKTGKPKLRRLTITANVGHLFADVTGRTTVPPNCVGFATLGLEKRLADGELRVTLKSACPEPSKTTPKRRMARVLNGWSAPAGSYTVVVTNGKLNGAYVTGKAKVLQPRKKTR